MLDLEVELREIIDALNGAMIDYAVCGGVAMAIHGSPRATIDIDLLVLAADADRIATLVAPLGYTFRARPMTLAGGAAEIRRITKTDPDGETLMLDLLLVTDAARGAWESRERLIWSGRDLFVVSREGLIELKSLRGSRQDLADIARLRGEE